MRERGRERERAEEEEEEERKKEKKLQREETSERERGPFSFRRERNGQSSGCHFTALSFTLLSPDFNFRATGSAR